MLRIDRRLISNMDWISVGIVLVIAAAGISTIYSATRPVFGSIQPGFYIKQTYWLMLGIAAMGMVVAVDYNWYNRMAYYLYGVGLVLLLAVLIMGRAGMGAQRWLSIGPIGIQPSELFKLAYIMALARYFAASEGSMDARTLGIGFAALALPPLILVLVQPDLGTSLVLLAVFCALALVRGLQRRLAVIVLAVMLISIPFLGSIAWENLQPYQKHRIISFVNPGSESAGALSYHVTQSKVAVGSGGMFGKGYLKGTQGPFRFLPEKHTDFIFAVFAEERGFVGCMIILLLFVTLLLRAVGASSLAKDAFGKYMCLGVVFLITMHCFVNIGMTMGLAPVVGLPLPFMSYGGSAMLTDCMSVGLVIGVRARRFELFF